MCMRARKQTIIVVFLLFFHSSDNGYNVSSLSIAIIYIIIIFYKL